jgi:hypothetical protein
MTGLTLEGRLPGPTGQEDGCTSETVGTQWSGERHLALHRKPNSNFPVFQHVFFLPVVCILLRILLLLTYVIFYTHFSCLLSYFPHYMFRPQRVIFRCSTYITLPLYCALTHFFLFQVATSMYIQPPTCSISPMALFHAL